MPSKMERFWPAALLSLWLLVDSGVREASGACTCRDVSAPNEGVSCGDSLQTLARNISLVHISCNALPSQSIPSALGDLHQLTFL